MREILFRAKMLDNGEWIKGYYIKATHHWHNHGIHEDWIAVDTIQNGGWCNVRGKYAVIPETVCQYTGLTDKNGQKIFEGDIVSTDIERPYLIVEFRDGCFMFNCNDGGEDYYDIMMPILKKPQKVYKYGEVIGNIFDNPELLKGGGTDE